MPASCLHPITRELKRRFPCRFQEINAHEKGNLEAVDFLWLSFCAHDLAIEGEVLAVGKYPDDQNTWVATISLAYRYKAGDWKTLWTTKGDEQAVLQAICSLPQIAHPAAQK